jgi:hypothetical protein
MHIQDVGRRMLAAGVLTAGLVAPHVASAGALDNRIVSDTDVTLSAPSYDFGSDTLVAGAPDGPGTMRLLTVSGVPEPTLFGYLNIDKAMGNCVFARLTYFDSAGAELDHRDSPQLCATDRAHHSQLVNFGDYADSSMTSVTASIISVTGLGETTVASQTIGIGPVLEDALITSNGNDLGDGTWDGSNPKGPATITWTYDGINGAPTANVTGVIHQDGVSGQCVRVLLEDINAVGNVVNSHTTQKSMCASSNSHIKRKIDVDDQNTSSAVVGVKVHLQVLNAKGNWQDAGSSGPVTGYWSLPYVVPA